MKYLAILSLLATANAHLALWHPAMYGINHTEPWQYKEAAPLQDLSFSDWWFHGYINRPPPEGYYMELPAGGVFRGQVACGKSLTTYGGAVDFQPRPHMACDKPGDDGNMGALHTPDKFGSPKSDGYVQGCGLAIAYSSDVHALKPEDFVVISVNHSCPWTREVDFAIPEGLPPCPAGGCHCLWGWVPDPSAVKQMYHLGYRCTVTGAVGSEPLAKPQVARKCPYEKQNCTIGAKQMHFIDQLQGNNNHQDRDDPAFYNDAYGFQDGAQLDIWQTDDGSKWIKNASDWAPRGGGKRPWEKTAPPVYSNTGGITTYPPVTKPGKAVSTIPVGVTAGLPMNSPYVSPATDATAATATTAESPSATAGTSAQVSAASAATSAGGGVAGTTLPVAPDDAAYEDHASSPGSTGGDGTRTAPAASTTPTKTGCARKTKRHQTRRSGRL